MHWSHTRLAFTLVLGASLLGCALHPRYESRIVETQKDVLFVIVSMPDRLDAAAYRRVAEKELEKLVEARRAGSVPLYEVRFEFLGPRGEDGREVKYASFAWRSPAGDLAVIDEGADLALR